MRVTLVQFGDEDVCAKAARLCTENVDAHQIFVKEPVPGDKTLLGRVVDSGHVSVLEHQYFTFVVSGISRACSHQLVRHWSQRFSQQSQRYLTLDLSDDQQEFFVTPPSISCSEKAASVYAKCMAQAAKTYHELLEAGVPPEDARFVLPNAAATQLVVTMNARSLLHFLEKRLCSGAQWEIATLATKMLQAAAKVSPVVLGRAGPPCRELGVCREPLWRFNKCRRGSMHVNHAKQVIREHIT